MTIRWIFQNVLLLSFLVNCSLNITIGQSLQHLNSYCDDLLLDKSFKSGDFAISVRDDSGKEILSKNSSKSLRPASNQKLITTFAALELLGENYSYKTILEYTGSIQNGTLNGDLIIRGSGDPTLGSSRFGDENSMDAVFAVWVTKLKAAGIHKIEGRIIGDASIFPKNNLPETWIWGDMGNYYGSAAYGLNINENLFRIYFKSGSTGSQTTILKTEPNLDGLQFENQVTAGTSGSGDNAYIFGDPYSSYRIITGTIPPSQASFAVKGSLPEPPLITAKLFKAFLQNNNVTVTKEAISIYSTKDCPITGRKEIYVHQSPSLKEIVKHTNMQSINLFAEALFNTLTLNSGKSGEAVVKDFLSQKGVELDGFFMQDGSGLSPFNGVTAAQLSGIVYVARSGVCYNPFVQSLPIAGLSGTLARIGKGTVAEGKILAKSGSIKRVVCYTGYATTKSGKNYSFSVMFNNYNCTNAEVIKRVERIFILLASLD